jgi:tetratricopeptide (TPR) repeat protein
MQLASIERDLGHNAEVERLYREVIALRPEYAPPYYQLALLLAENDDNLPEVARLLGKVAELEPKSARVQYNLGIAWQRMGRPGDAEGALYKAWELEPRSIEYLNALVILYSQNEDWANALEFAEKLVRLDPRFEREYMELQRRASAPK